MKSHYMSKFTALILGIILSYAAKSNELSLNENALLQKKMSDYSSSNIGFEPNLGQISDFKGKAVKEILFRAKLPGYSIFITEKGVSYVLYQVESQQGKAPRTMEENFSLPDDSAEKSILHYARIDLDLLNAKITLGNIEFEDPLVGYNNYYLPQNPDGLVNVRSYAKIRIKEVYPGIDWVWRMEGDKMHHEFEVSPGADYSQIKLKVKWADLEIGEAGKKLSFSTPIGKIEDGEILAFEQLDNTTNPIEVYYNRNDEDILSYNVKNYKGTHKLIIDPPLSLLWATYYGGSSADAPWSCNTDDSGNLYIIGNSQSTNFPTQNPGAGNYFQGTNSGNDDAFILKFNNAGVRQWATYYGGSNIDYARSCVMDGAGNVFVVGHTTSTDFPTQNPGGGAYFQGINGGIEDAFILKFNNSGARQWATYYGGNSNDYAWSCALDVSENLFVTGYSYSTNFPTLNSGGGSYFQVTNAGSTDISILKFSNSGVRLWATNYGGLNSDVSRSCATDGSGNLFVTGYSLSTDFPTQNPGGGAYFQGLNAGNSDVIILKFNNSGVRQWATYYGGNSSDVATSIASNGSNVILTGYGQSTNLPTQNPGGGAYFQGSYAGIADAFILKFNNSGVRQWATYYGGSNGDYASSCVIDVSGNLFIAGYSSSIDLPTQNPGGGAYFQSFNSGGDDVFILKFNPSGVRQWGTYYGGTNGDNAFYITKSNSGSVFVTGYTTSTNIPTQNPGGGAYFQATNGGGLDCFLLEFSNCNNTSATITEVACNSYTAPDAQSYTNSGTYLAIIPNMGGCDSTITINLIINSSTSGSSTISSCDNYTWAANGNNYINSGIYTAVLTNSAGCDSIGTLNLTINSNSSGSETINACDSYTWTANGSTYTNSGVYTAILTNAVGCDSTATLNLTINNSSSGSASVSVCDSYIWTANGNTYTNTGVYIAMLTNAAGCDSTATLNLTINNSNSGSSSVTACDNYTWTANGNTYTNSGVYTAVLTNAAGCDSTATLNLTINNSNSGSSSVTACDNYTWAADGNTYANTGVYNAVLTNAAGCDSTATLDLTINFVDASVTITSTTLSANSASGTYQWLNCDANMEEILGATDQSYTPAANGNYAVVVTFNSCADTSTCYSMNIIGLLESDLDNSLSIYPNPSDGTFVIEDDNLHLENALYEITDYSGRKLQIGELTEKKTIIHLTEISGVYTVKIITNSGEVLNRKLEIIK